MLHTRPVYSTAAETYPIPVRSCVLKLEDEFSMWQMSRVACSRRYVFE